MESVRAAARPVPLPEPASPARVQRWKASVLPMAAERGLVMKVPPVSPRTRLTFQAVELAREHGTFDAMHRAIFEAFFCEGLDIGDANVLARPRRVNRSRSGAPDASAAERDLSRSRPAAGTTRAEPGGDRCPGDVRRRRLARAEPVIGAVPVRLDEGAPWTAPFRATSLEWRRRSLASSIPLKPRE